MYGSLQRSVTFVHPDSLTANVAFVLYGSLSVLLLSRPLIHFISLLLSDLLVCFAPTPPPIYIKGSLMRFGTLIPAGSLTASGTLKRNGSLTPVMLSGIRFTYQFCCYWACWFTLSSWYSLIPWFTLPWLLLSDGRVHSVPMLLSMMLVHFFGMLLSKHLVHLPYIFI